MLFIANICKEISIWIGNDFVNNIVTDNINENRDGETFSLKLYLFYYYKDIRAIHVYHSLLSISKWTLKERLALPSSKTSLGASVVLSNLLSYLSIFMSSAIQSFKFSPNPHLKHHRMPTINMPLVTSLGLYLESSKPSMMPNKEPASVNPSTVLSNVPMLIRNTNAFLILTQ